MLCSSKYYLFEIANIGIDIKPIYRPCSQLNKSFFATDHKHLAPDYRFMNVAQSQYILL